MYYQNTTQHYQIIGQQLIMSCTKWENLQLNLRDKNRINVACSPNMAQNQINEQKTTRNGIIISNDYFIFQHNLKYQQRPTYTMESSTKEERKSTANSSRGRVHKNDLNFNTFQYADVNLVNIITPKGSSYQNIHNFPISPRVSKKSVQLSVSPRINIAGVDDEDFDKERQHSLGPSNGSTMRDQDVMRYECIASLTEQQNKNLRDQNKYLLQKLRKMQEREQKVKRLFEKAKKYKAMYLEAQSEIQVLKDECQIYKQQAQEMKKIILNDVYRLKQKVLQTQISSLETIQEQVRKQRCDRDYKNNQSTSTEIKSGRVSSESSLSKYFKNEQF